MRVLLFFERPGCPCMITLELDRPKSKTTQIGKFLRWHPLDSLSSILTKGSLEPTAA